MQNQRLKWLKILIPAIIIAAATLCFRNEARRSEGPSRLKTNQIISEPSIQGKHLQTSGQKRFIRLRKSLTAPWQGVIDQTEESRFVATTFIEQFGFSAFINFRKKLQLLLYPFHSYW